MCPDLYKLCVCKKKRNMLVFYFPLVSGGPFSLDWRCHRVFSDPRSNWEFLHFEIMEGLLLATLKFEQHHTEEQHLSLSDFTLNLRYVFRVFQFLRKKDLYFSFDFFSD